MRCVQTSDMPRSAARKHDEVEHLVWGCLIYDFKVGLSADASSRQISQGAVENTHSECTAWKWFLKFRSEDLSICDEPRSSSPHFPGNPSQITYTCSRHSQTSLRSRHLVLPPWGFRSWRHV